MVQLHNRAAGLGVLTRVPHVGTMGRPRPWTYPSEGAAAHRVATSGSPFKAEGNRMSYVITEPCIDVKDKACVEVCPVDCIYEGPHQLFIHPDECIDCGACEPVCPVKAIFTEDEVPEPSKPFIELNRQFFVDNPGVKPTTTRS